MARYYIDTDDGVYKVVDAEGYDLANANLARELAIEALPEMARDGIEDDSGRKHFQVSIRNETGAIIFVADLFLEERWVARPAA